MKHCVEHENEMYKNWIKRNNRACWAATKIAIKPIFESRVGRKANF